MAKVKVNKAPTIQDEKGFHNFALVVMILLAIYCVIPFLLMLSVSFSSEAALSHGYRFWPQEFSLSAYQFLWVKRATIFRAYALTILVTVVGTVANLILTSLFDYPLSRKDFKQCVRFYPFLHHALQRRHDGQLHHLDPGFPHQGHRLGLYPSRKLDGSHERADGPKLL